MTTEIPAKSLPGLSWFFILLGLHVVAIAFYLLWKRTNLVRPMITGVRVFAMRSYCSCCSVISGLR